MFRLLPSCFAMLLYHVTLSCLPERGSSGNPVHDSKETVPLGTAGGVYDDPGRAGTERAGNPRAPGESVL